MIKEEIKDAVRCYFDDQEMPDLVKITECKRINLAFSLYWLPVCVRVKCKKQTGLDFQSHPCRHTVATQLLRRGAALDLMGSIMVL